MMYTNTLKIHLIFSPKKENITNLIKSVFFVGLQKHIVFYEYVFDILKSRNFPVKKLMDTSIPTQITTLTDNVITLKPFDLNDATIQLANEDPAHEKWLSGGKSTLESVQNWIEKNSQYWKQDGPVYNFAIFLNKESRLIGMVEANKDRKSILELEEGDANISYSIYPFARGKGYATRAVMLMMQFLKTKGVKRAIIRIDPENTNSLKIPQRCGFKKETFMTTGENKKLVIFTKTL